MGKKHDELEVKMRGSVIYAYLILREMFEVDRDAKEPMRCWGCARGSHR